MKTKSFTRLACATVAVSLWTAPFPRLYVRPGFTCLCFLCLCMWVSRRCGMEAQSITNSRGINCNQCTEFRWQPTFWPLPGWPLLVAQAAKGIARVGWQLIGSGTGKVSVAHSHGLKCYWHGHNHNICYCQSNLTGAKHEQILWTVNTLL